MACRCWGLAFVLAATTPGCGAGRAAGGQAASAAPPAPTGGVEPCTPAGQAACPIELSLGATAGAASALLQGELTASAPSRFYRFCVPRPARLSWQWTGSAVHLVLQDPRGEVDGPGLSNPIRLESAGCYLLGLSANTMADNAFGSFRLTLALEP